MRGVYDFKPETEGERSDYERFLALAKKDEAAALGRGAEGHLAACALVFDRTGRKILLEDHKIFRALSAPGGHSDGERDPLFTAIREVKEETGIDAVPYSTDPIAFRALPFKAHIRRGVPVAEHEHFVFLYALTALNETVVNCAEESDSAAFYDALRLDTFITEDHMRDFYRAGIEKIRRVEREKAAVFHALPAVLVPWFLKNKRDLPWRRDRTPYRVWLAEIMLQQTRVEAVKDYYLRFLAAAPTVEALCALSDERLMKLWEGLGYYTRMRNLKRAAEIVVNERGGAFPDTAEGLLKLPGVGRYTAGAVASIAFGQKSAAVDGNVVRVVSRVTENFLPADSERYKRELAARLEAICPDGLEGEFTESLMELGATVCLPNGAPLCPVCPLQDACLARRGGSIAHLPVIRAKPAKKTVAITVFLLRSPDGKIAVKKRAAQGVLSGMWEFPNFAGSLLKDEAERALADRGYGAVTLGAPRAAKHVFTHLVWEMTAYRGAAETFPADVRAASEAELQTEISLPSAFRKLL